MRIIVAPDKFKGSLDSFEVCRAISKGIKKANQSIEVLEFPLADGGDGFASVLKQYLTTETIYCDAEDPLHRKIKAAYEWNEKSKTAIIEMAVASGLVLLKEEERNPLATSTYGTGLIIKDAIDKGADTIVLGLGGSATNDGGMGILAALGFRFLNDKDQQLAASGENILRIQKIIPPPVIPALKFEIACDVQNVLFGQQGAAYVYAPQKGADEEQVRYLDRGLMNWAALLQHHTEKEIATSPGTGAAGGIAAGLLAFFEVEIRQGVEIVVDASNIKQYLRQADLLITGEGKIDEQSNAGKVVGYMAALSNEFDISCIAFCGELQLDEKAFRQMGLRNAIAIMDNSRSKSEAMKNAGKLLMQKAMEINIYL